MRLFERWPVRLAAFAAGFALLLWAMDFLCYVPSPKNAVVMDDLYRTENSDIVAIGNSQCYVHINPMILEEELGRSAFTLGIDAARSETIATLAREVFRVRAPRQLLLVFDPSMYFFAEEDISVYTNLIRYIESPASRLNYLASTLQGDLTDLNRFFPWRHQIISLMEKNEPFTQWKNYLPYKLDKQRYLRDSLDFFAGTYRGRGFFAQTGEEGADAARTRAYPAISEPYIPMPDVVRDMMRRVKALCDENGCELIVITTPQIRNIVLAEERYQHALATMEAYCAQIGVPYYNFTCAREELLSYAQLTEHYYDAGSHLDHEGAAILSRALARVLRMQDAGEDAGTLFYTMAQWLETIDFVSNLWLEREQTEAGMLYTAMPGCGPAVKPEYRFLLTAAYGTQSVLRDWDEEEQLLIGWDAIPSGAVCVQSRNMAAPAQAIVTSNAQ